MNIQEIKIFLKSILDDLEGFGNIASINDCIIELQNKVDVLKIQKTEMENHLSELDDKIKESNDKVKIIKMEGDNYYSIKIKEADDYVNQKKLESRKIISNQKEIVYKLNSEMTEKHENIKKEANEQLNYVNEEIKAAYVNLNYINKKIKEANDTLANIHKQMDEFKSKT